jgi:hypothetical protein
MERSSAGTQKLVGHEKNQDAPQYLHCANPWYAHATGSLDICLDSAAFRGIIGGKRERALGEGIWFMKKADGQSCG